MKKYILIIIVLFSVNFTTHAQTKPAENNMYFSTQVEGNIEDVFEKLQQDLKTEKFGVVTEIDMDKTLNEKLGVELMPYKIIGICSPKHAYKAIQAEENIGVFLPCKMILKQIDKDIVEVVAVNPAVMMGMLQNSDLTEVGNEVGETIQRVINNLE